MSEISAMDSVKRILVGRPIPSRFAKHERFSKVTGLAVLASDALSSVAYATEEVVRTLILAGASTLFLSTPIAAVISVLLLIVAFSYRQTIHAYPGGGGAYRVAKENLGVGAGLVAAAALLVDYVLTVAVSVAAGVAALTSAFPEWHVNRVGLCLAFVTILALGNLRGIRESGRIFSVPTYLFIVILLGLIATGIWRVAAGQISPVESAGPLTEIGTHPLTLFLILRAFANGCTAMTGVEAVADGVPAFRPPEARNAAATLLVMAVLGVTLFMGITVLSQIYGILPVAEETVVSQLARAVFGGRGLFYYAVQGATMLILVLAANTAYSDFPRLASIIARDRFLPRQLMNQGDRLAFSNGIIALSVIASALIFAFGGDTHRLIPLYMVGVFVSFTLSQAGMVLKWRRERPPGWLPNAVVNGVGATLTSIVLVVVGLTKFSEGAWITMILIPLVMFQFRMVRRHYEQVAVQLSLKDWEPPKRRHNTVIVPIGGIHRAVVEALQYARSLSDDVRAVYVNTDPEAAAEIRRHWDRWGSGVSLVVLESPYRSVVRTLVDYIDEVHGERKDDFVTVVLPEFVPARWWHHFLHNQRALLLKGALLFKPNTVVTNVPYHLKA